MQPASRILQIFAKDLNLARTQVGLKKRFSGEPQRWNVLAFGRVQIRNVLLTNHSTPSPADRGFERIELPFIT